MEQLEQNDEEDGLQEKNVARTNHFIRDREKGPRFVPRSSFEYEFAMRWKELFELEKQKREDLEREIVLERTKLEDQMEFALYEQETSVLRERKYQPCNSKMLSFQTTLQFARLVNGKELRMREEEANQLLREREMRQRRVEQQMCQQQQQQQTRIEEMYQQSPDTMRQRPNTGISLDAMRQRPNTGISLDDMRRRQDSPMMMQVGRHSIISWVCVTKYDRNIVNPPPPPFVFFLLPSLLPLNRYRYAIND